MEAEGRERRQILGRERSREARKQENVGRKELRKEREVNERLRKGKNKRKKGWR